MVNFSMGKFMRTSDIIRVGYHADGVRGPDYMYVVHMFEDNILIEARELPNKSKWYAESLAKNWEKGIIENDK